MKLKALKIGNDEHMIVFGNEAASAISWHTDSINSSSFESANIIASKMNATIFTLRDGCMEIGTNKEVLNLSNKGLISLNDHQVALLTDGRLRILEGDVECDASEMAVRMLTSVLDKDGDSKGELRQIAIGCKSITTTVTAIGLFIAIEEFDASERFKNLSDTLVNLGVKDARVSPETVGLNIIKIGNLPDSIERVTEVTIYPHKIVNSKTFTYGRFDNGVLKMSSDVVAESRRARITNNIATAIKLGKIDPRFKDTFI